MARTPYLLDIQTDLLSSLATRLVVPFHPRPDPGFTVIERLHPTITLGGQACVAVVSEMAAVPKTALGERMDSLPAFRQAIMDACDLMLTGFDPSRE
jgi:toxin CcdB